MGEGGHLSLISIWPLYILISCMFQMGEGVIFFDIYMVSIYSYKLTVSNGGGGSFGFGIYMVSIYSYKLYVSNGGGHHLPLISIWSLYNLIS